MHDVLVEVLEPLRKMMENGINLICPDGQRRFCFPVLAQYIADYEEQHVLASILSGYCPKCTIPAFKSQLLLPPNDGAPAPSQEPVQHPRSTKGAPKATSGKKNMKRARNDSTVLPEPKRVRVTCESSGSDSIIYPSRTGYEAKRLRSLHTDPIQLKKFGYHPTMPFTERHIHSDIYQALAPDLLHQASKGFYDYIHD